MEDGLERIGALNPSALGLVDSRMLCLFSVVGLGIFQKKPA